MKQMHVDESLIVDFNYEATDIPTAVKEFRPVVFRDKDRYSCLLGEDYERGILGQGDTQHEALIAWEKNFKERLQHHAEADELVQYINDSRNVSKKDVW